MLESRAGSAVGQPSRSGSSAEERRNEQAGRLAALNGAAPPQAPGMAHKVPALHLPGRLKGESASDRVLIQVLQVLRQMALTDTSAMKAASYSISCSDAWRPGFTSMRSATKPFTFSFHLR